MDSRVIELSQGQRFIPHGIASTLLHQDPYSKVLMFHFDAGQQLSEHTSSFPAIMHFLEGEAHVKLGDQRVNAKAGTWIQMPAGELHAIDAEIRTSMLLTLFLNHPAKT